ncbi:MAG: MFS transporter [Dehalococcoidia bacterium]|nr:MFS transporter [Dehalococcoidia bacterium]
MTEANAQRGHTLPVSKWQVLAAVMLGTFMMPLDASIVNTVLPAITDVLHTDISIAQWAPTVYLLTICCLILLWGRLGDVVGYRRVFLTGLAAFTLTSMLCGLSQSIWMLILFRALQGLSASMVMAVGFAIITSAFPARERGKALGIYATGIAIALALGPTLGGLIAQNLSWRYVFIINVPIGIASLLWGTRIIPRSGSKPAQRLDWAGAVTALFFLLAVLVYANRGQDWGWSSPLALGVLAAGMAFGALFIQVERSSAQPMLNLSLFANRVFSFASLSSLLNFMAMYALVFVTPFYLMFVLHYDVFKVGLVMAASPVITLCVAPFTGAASDRFGTRFFAIFGMSISAVGMFLLANLTTSASAFDVAWRLSVIGLGSGMFQSPNNSTVMGSVPVQHLGIASGLLAAMRNVGMVLGIGVAGAVLYAQAPVSATSAPGAFGPGDIARFMTGVRWAYIAGGALAATAALTSLLAAGKLRKPDRRPGDETTPAS